MSAGALIAALNAAIDRLETALDEGDADAITVASAALAQALAPFGHHDFANDPTRPAAELGTVLARIDALRVRVAVVADLDRRRAQRSGAADLYGRAGRLRVVPTR